MRQDVYPVSIVEIKAILLVPGKINFMYKMSTVIKNIRMNDCTYNITIILQT